MQKFKESDFLNGIQFLIENGVITIESNNDSKKLLIGGFDLSQAGPTEGAEDALFTIIMFSDHQCEKCAKWLIHEKKILFFRMTINFASTRSRFCLLPRTRYFFIVGSRSAYTDPHQSPIRI